MEEYCLIARNKDTNEVKTISLKESWYLKKANPTFKRKNSLEAIDLVTTQFPNQKTMIKKMYENGYLDTLNVDLFIAKKIKNKNKQYIKYNELIYNPENKERITDLREIAYAFLANQQSEKQNLIDKVFNKLISKASSKKYFREMLFFGDTNVSKRITDNFDKNTNDYSLKYQNKNFYDSYSSIRNVVEALERYDYLEPFSENVYDSNIKYLNGFLSARKKIEPLLLEILDKDYIEGQYNLFTDYTSKETTSSNEEKLKTKETKQESLEEFFLPEIPSDLTIEEKRHLIINTFYELPFGLLNIEDNKKKVNAKLFSKEKELSTLEQEELETLLPTSLFTKLIIYTAHKNEYEKCLLYFANTNHLEEEIRKDKQELSTFLKKTSDLDRILLWSMIIKNKLSFHDKNENVGNKK